MENNRIVKKQSRLLVLLFAGILLAASALTIYTYLLADDRGSVCIEWQGESIYNGDFSLVEDVIRVQAGPGNIVCIAPDGVWMEFSDCPDQCCVRQGKIENGLFPIVCLPNQVTVWINGGENRLDGVTGQ